MYAKVDSEGYVHNMMKDASSVDKYYMYIKTKSGQRRIQKTTVLCNLLDKYNNGTDKCIPLKDLKESNPVEVAEFSSAIGIEI